MQIGISYENSTGYSYSYNHWAGRKSFFRAIPEDSVSPSTSCSPFGRALHYAACCTHEAQLSSEVIAVSSTISTKCVLQSTRKGKLR